MKRRLCPYGMFEVADGAYFLSDSGGEMYFCNARCLCVWAVQLATRPASTIEKTSGGFFFIASTCTRINFKGMADVARWAVENSLIPKRL